MLEYWRIVWNGKLFFKSYKDGIAFINNHPGCSAQYIKIGR